MRVALGPPTATPSGAAAAGPLHTDALVIGAGPAGIFQAFELGLLGIHAHVVDAMQEPGGQCAALYADKPIYDIPSVTVCTGRELVARLLAQVRPFAPDFHLGQTVDTLTVQADGRLGVTTSAGTSFSARSVFLAAGTGAFTPRRLKLDGIDRLEGSQVFHRDVPVPALPGKHVVVLGGDDLALDRVFALATGNATPTPASVTLLHRRAVLQADPARIERFEALRRAGRASLVVGQPNGIVSDGGCMVGLEMLDADGNDRTLPLDILVVALGLSPRLGPLADWGLVLERKQVPVDTATFATNLPGLYAIGDINTYPGKKKLILSAFHEATLAAFAAAERMFPDRRFPLQYTTSSTELQRRLGVVAPSN